MQYLDYRQKLGIGLNDSQMAGRFLQRVSNYLLFSPKAETIYECVTDEMLFEYCNTIGADYNYVESIAEDIASEDDMREFLVKYSVLMHLVKGNTLAYQYYRTLLQENLDACRIQYELLEDDNGLYVFPKGAVELDNALVSEPLTWLASYPKTHAAFVKALKEYAEAESGNASDVADKFRKALETFFREFFSVEKSLENCKAEYGRYLKEHGVPPEISGNFETLLQAYTNYMNGYAKHQDRTSKNVLEYLMYQTGNIIRLLITLKQEAEANAD